MLSRALGGLQLLIWLLGFNAEIPCGVSSMYTVRPNLHAVLGPGRYTHLNAGEVESTASGWFLCSAFHTIRRWYRAGLALPCLVFFFAGEVECQMGPDMLLNKQAPQSGALVINNFVFQAPRCALGTLLSCLAVHEHVVAGTC